MLDAGDGSDGLSPGTSVSGRYRVERELGRGGMATVYLARDLPQDRLVALKTLHPELSGALGADRFLREISIASRLQHPNILPLFDSGTTDLGGGEARSFYVMPYVPGESLRARLQRETQLGLDEAIRICGQVAAALDHAHAQGIVHRDIKPENILLEGEQAVVADFGVATALDAAGGEKLTQTGISLGTPAYMSPEQATAKRVDARSDVYSLACVMYEMLVGDPPFLGSSARAVMARHALDPVPSVRTARPEVPEYLEAALRRGLAKVPGDRFASAGELAAAVAGAGPVVGASAPARTRRGRLAAALALGSLGLIALWHWRPIPGQPTEPRRVAVLPFDVSAAAPDLAWLGEGMVDLFSAQLRGDTALQVADPRTVLGAWYRARARGDTTGGADARLAGRIGAGRVVEGTVVGSPARLVLSAAIRPIGRQQPGPRVTVTGPADSLPVLVDRLTAQLVGIDAGVDGQRLASLISNSLPAVRAFAEGRAQFRRGHVEEATRYLREATVLDSTFALAALELATVSTWSGGGENTERGRRLAWLGRARLNPTDRALVKSWQAPWTGAPSMFANQRALVAAYPDQPHFWYDLGDTYFHWGILAGQDSALEEARRAFQRGWAIDSATTLDSSATVRSPLFAEPLTHMVDLAQLAGDTAEVLRLTALGLEANAAGAQAHYLQWHQALALGDSARRAFWANQNGPRDLPGRVVSFTQTTGIAVEDGARAIAEDMVGASGDYAGFLREIRRSLALSGGRPQEAKREFPASPSRSGSRERILDALYWQGDTVGIADLARRLVILPKVPGADLAERREQYYDLCAGFQWWLSQGETQGAAKAAGLLRTAHIPGLSEGDSAVFARSTGLCAALLQALQTAHPEAGAASVAYLDSLARTDVFQVCCGETTVWDGNLGANLVVARVAEYQGDLPLALRALRRRASGFELGAAFLSTFLREEGRLSALTGDTAAAIRAYQHYLALRRDPEAALRPEVERVRAELTALLSEPPGRSR